MTLQTELRRLAGLPILAAYRDTLLAAARKIDAVEAARAELEQSDKTTKGFLVPYIGHLRSRVNELAEIVRTFEASARFAEEVDINTEPEK